MASQQSSPQPKWSVYKTPITTIGKALIVGAIFSGRFDGCSFLQWSHHHDMHLAVKRLSGSLAYRWSATGSRVGNFTRCRLSVEVNCSERSINE
jgi:hypothetical protein